MHYIQANRAFQVDRVNVRFSLLTDYGFASEGDEAWVELTSRQGGVPQRWKIVDGSRLRTVLGRDDVVLVEGRPLVVANEPYAILGIAVGHLGSDRRVRISPIFGLKDSTLDSMYPDQPTWWLFDARPDSSPG